MQIELLADRPEFIPTLAAWHFHEWAYSGPVILSPIAFGFFMSALVDASCPSRSLRRLVQSYWVRPCSSTMRWTRGQITRRGSPESSLLLRTGSGASGAHSRSTSSTPQRRSAFPRFIFLRRALSISFRGSAGVSWSIHAIEIPMSLSCRTPKSPNQSLEPTAGRRDAQV